MYGEKGNKKKSNALVREKKEGLRGYEVGVLPPGLTRHAELRVRTKLSRSTPLANRGSALPSSREAFIHFEATLACTALYCCLSIFFAIDVSFATMAYYCGVFTLHVGCTSNNVGSRFRRIG